MTLPPPTDRPLLASELFGITQGIIATGRHTCYWCTAPCGQDFTHNEPRLVGVRNMTAKHIGSPFVCKCCVAYRRPKSTVVFLSGGFKDGQSLSDHSWIATKQGVWAIRHSHADDAKALYSLLLDVPKTFTLALRTSGKNLLQFAVANDRDGQELRADTVNSFTIDGAVFHYNAYELEAAARNGDANGAVAGVRELFRVLGPCPKELLIPGDEERKGRGKQKLDDGKITKAAIRTPKVSLISGTAYPTIPQ